MTKAFSPFRIALCMALLVLALAPSVFARGATSAAQNQALDEAEQAERAMDFEGARAAYQRAVDADPESRLSRRARARLGWLAERSEGGYAPLRALEKLRRTREPTPEELAAFERELDAVPPGVVKREGRALVTEGYLFRLDRPRDALRAASAWLEEPNLDDADFIRASNDLALARARLGDLDGSLETLHQRGLGRTAEASYVRLALIRRWAQPLALLAIGLFVGFGFGVRRPRWPRVAELRRAWSWPRILAAGWALGVPLWLARHHRPETWRTFSLWMPAALAILAAAAVIGSGASAPSRRARSILAALGVLAQVGAAYLALDHSGALLGWLVTWRVGG